MAERAEDAELVAACQRGDRAAFARLVERHLRLAGAAAYAVLGSYEEAADAVQEAFLKVQHRLGELREPQRFRSWLYGLVRTTALDRRRRQRREPAAATPESAALERIADERPAVPEHLAHAELRAQVRRAVAQLPASYREVVVLKYLDERSYEEIAALLGESISAIESRLHRARALLRRQLRGLVPEREE
ncbi:MAG: hypothetical protein KatS3mg102_1652 [Planctomycetota bacterium]|nr:MAG: hypothetical protein KatS3mg102_1652 [Planctomycetota bacterium]